MYRIRPSVCHTPFAQTVSTTPPVFGRDVSKSINPNQLRWKPLAASATPGQSFVSGLRTISSHGTPEAKDGLAIHVYRSDSWQQ